MGRDAGYATLAVTGLLGTLSLVGAAYMNLGVAEANRADAIATQLTLDTAIEGVWLHVVSDIVSGVTAPDAIDDVGLTGFADHSFVWRVTDEAKKANVRLDGEDEIKAATGRFRITPDPTALKLDQSFPPDLADQELRCLRDRLTVFQPASSARGAAGDRARRISDGAIVRIQIEVEDQAPRRGLDTAVLLTGARDTPYKVMSWRRYTGTEIAAPSCA